MATLVALLGAMFMAMGSASAIAFGDCNTGNSENHLTVGDTCSLPSGVPPAAALAFGSAVSVTGNSVAVIKDNNPDSNGDQTVIEATSDGKATVTVITDAGDDNKVGGTGGNADTSTTMSFVVRLEPSISISFGNDTDAIVAAGTPVAVTVTTKGISAVHTVRIETPAPTYFTAVNAAADTGNVQDTSRTLPSSSQFVTVKHSALLDADQGATETPPQSDVSYMAKATLSTSGVPAGDYTVTASVSGGMDGAGNVAAGDRIMATKTLTVGDPGSNVATAALALAPLDAGNNVVSTSKAVKTQSSTVPARGGKVHLTLNVLNSLGSLSNASSTAQLDITVTAVGAKLTRMSSTLANGVASATTSGDATSTDGSLQYKTNGPINVITVEKSRPGAVTVSALVVGDGGGGYATSESIDLTFTGDVATISLGEASGTLLRHTISNAVAAKNGSPAVADSDHRDVISFSLGAADSEGSATAIPTVSFQITDSDGNNVDLEKKIEPVQGPSSSGVPNAKITLSTKVGRATSLPTGEYTLKASQSSRITDTAMFTVVDMADEDGVSVDLGETNANGEFEITVSANDADGNPVADGTPVTVEAPDLRGDGDRVLYIARSDGKTKAGMAMATLVEIGHGNAAIIVTVDGVTRVSRYTSTYDAPEPVEEEPEVVSADCLSTKSGFSVWTCGVDSTASEVFGMVSSRGASAIHLWNGSAWVRYSVVDGSEVPGSSDFMVNERDILYISN